MRGRQIGGVWLEDGRGRVTRLAGRAVEDRRTRGRIVVARCRGRLQILCGGRGVVRITQTRLVLGAEEGAGLERRLGQLSDQLVVILVLMDIRVEGQRLAGRIAEVAQTLVA